MRKSQLGILVAVGFSCCACGGGGSSSAQPGQYAGAYAGEFIDKTGAAGQLNLTVTGTGPETVTGQYVYPTKTVSFTGTIDNGGSGTLYFRNQVFGSFNLGPAGQPTTTLAVSALQTITLPGGVPVNYPEAAQVVLISNPTGIYGGANPFAGAYAGTVVDSTQSKTTVVAINIASSGAVTGSSVSLSSSVPKFGLISGTVSSTGALSTSTQSGDLAGSGTVSLSGGTITGELRLSNGDAANLSLSQVQSTSASTGPVAR